MLDYLGSSAGGGQTMPSAVPGAGRLGDTLSAIRGAVPTNAPPFGLPVPPQSSGPQDMEYVAVTQADGTVLLHMKNADGSLGPAVKIISPPKPQGAGGQPA